MHTLVHLFRHVKEQGNDPFLLEIIRAVIRERLPMPHAAVWWIMESIRLKSEAPDITTVVAHAKTVGVTRDKPWLDEDLYLEGYVVSYQFVDHLDEYDYDEFVVTAQLTKDLTANYIHGRL